MKFFYFDLIYYRILVIWYHPQHNFFIIVYKKSHHKFKQILSFDIFSSFVPQLFLLCYQMLTLLYNFLKISIHINHDLFGQYF